MLSAPALSRAPDRRPEGGNGVIEYLINRRGRCPLARCSSRRRAWLPSRGGRRRSRAELLLLLLDEFAIIRRVEVKQRPTRGKMLDEYLTDYEGGARG